MSWNSGNDEVTVAPNELLAEFRVHFSRFESAVHHTLSNPTDSTVLARLGDDLDEFAILAIEVSHLIFLLVPDRTFFMQNSRIFDDAELVTLRVNLSLMQGDIRQRYDETLDSSHHGRPTIVQSIRTGNRGRPRIHIDPVFLQWAYSQRSTSGISRFLNVGRQTVRDALLDYGIAAPQHRPFLGEISEDQDDETGEDILHDHLLDPELPAPPEIPSDVINLADPSSSNPLPSPHVTSFTGPISSLTNDELDSIVNRLRAHFRRAGISMLDGMLRRLGHRVPRERIRESLMRIDPVQRVFQRIRIRRRKYSVPGPNALWHHDGQHGAFSCSTAPIRVLQWP